MRLAYALAGVCLCACTRVCARARVHAPGVFPCRCHSLSRSTIARYGEGCSPRFSFRRLSSILVAVGGGGGGGGEARGEEEEVEEEGERV